MKNVKLYHGNEHNNETNRPPVGATCYRVTINRDGATVHAGALELINILVHGGRYDSYVLKNPRTGKITYSRAIAIYNDEH